MFLGKIFGLFTVRKNEVKRYADIIWSEYVQNRNADIAMNKGIEFAKQKNMSDTEIKEGKEQICQNLESYLETTSDIREQEMEELKVLINNLNLSVDKKNIMLKMALDRYLILMALNGKPYEFDKNSMPLSIVYKNGEKLYYLHNAINVKKTRKTVAVNYGGPVASIQICKGVKYRLGSMRISRETVETFDTSDKGIFYITNMRIGYLGRTQFSFDLKKIISIQSGEAGLLIYKEGRQNPFMISFDEYDVPCSILSCLLNQNL